MEKGAAFPARSTVNGRPLGRPGFGELLKKHRVAAGVTQDYLAEIARVSANAISSLERGVRRAPHRDTVSLLASALRV